MSKQPLPHERILHWLDDHRGIYIPRDFAESIATKYRAPPYVEGVTEEQWAILENGPGGMLDKDHNPALAEHYWDTWSEVEQSAKLYLDRIQLPNRPHQPTDHFWRIQQDGSCFLIRDDVEHCDQCDTWKERDCGCPHNGPGFDEEDEHGFQVGQRVQLVQAMQDLGWPSEPGILEDILQPETSPYLIRWTEDIGNGSTCLKVHRSQLTVCPSPADEYNRAHSIETHETHGDNR